MPPETPATISISLSSQTILGDRAFVLDIQSALCDLFARLSEQVGKTGDMAADSELAARLVVIHKTYDKLEEVMGRHD